MEDQKDAFQDIILQLWKSFGTFRGESEISTWIYRVSLNTILSKVSKKKKKCHKKQDKTKTIIIRFGGKKELEKQAQNRRGRKNKKEEIQGTRNGGEGMEGKG